MNTPPAPSGYLPGLNGLRAIAAVTVFILHINDTLPSFGLPFLGRTPGGLYAVTVFFALSGFLITYLLLKEKDKKGTVSITNFYIRRTLRIWPLYFTVLGLGLLFNYLNHETYDTSLILYSIFFAANIPNCANIFIPNLGHLWSLGVEEQFYLTWPWMIKFARRPIFVLVGFLILFIAAKAAARYIYGGVSPEYMFFYTARFDCMAIGGIGAWLYWRGIPAKLQQILFSVPAQVISWLALAATIPDWFQVFSFVNHFLIGCFSVVIILNLIANPKPIFRLENSVWRYLGSISFGIYMWHPLVIVANSLALPYLQIPDLGKIGYMVIVSGTMTILLAHLSMKYLETPFLRLKRH